MVRGGMRIGEVLKLRVGDIQDRKLLLRNPKSGLGVELCVYPTIKHRYMRNEKNLPLYMSIIISMSDDRESKI